jgi:lipopolysaccharide assembly outer membrane protein LptD (OstA)
MQNQKLALLRAALTDNVQGIGPVRNADIYGAMIDSPWLSITPDMVQKEGLSNSLSATNPSLETSAGYISPRDANLITTFGIPSEYTDVFTQDPYTFKDPEFASKDQKNATIEGVAGPVSDPNEYNDIKKRADKTAKKKITFEDLVLKSKGIE